jgi:hypothetical protein
MQFKILDVIMQGHYYYDFHFATKEYEIQKD